MTAQTVFGLTWDGTYFWTINNRKNVVKIDPKTMTAVASTYGNVFSSFDEPRISKWEPRLGFN